MPKKSFETLTLYNWPTVLNIPFLTLEPNGESVLAAAPRLTTFSAKVTNTMAINFVAFVVWNILTLGGNGNHYFRRLTFVVISRGVTTFRRLLISTPTTEEMENGSPLPGQPNLPSPRTAKPKIIPSPLKHQLISVTSTSSQWQALAWRWKCVAELKQL